MRRGNDGSWQYSPTDLIAWLEGDFAAWCERECAEQVAAGGSRDECGRDLRSAEMELVAEYGMAHERGHLERLRTVHPDLIEVDSRRADAAERTRTALEAGVSMVYQGVLAGERWFGIADFLHRVPEVSRLGDWSYEPWDTKLARSAKPYFLIQLCTYAELLEELQHRRPSRLQFILGDGTQVSHPTAECWHYFQRLKRRFERFQGEWNADQMPDPGADRSHGQWTQRAELILAERDDLSLVANITRSQVVRLREAGITTLTQLGESAPEAVLSGMSRATFIRLREQAAMQLRSRGHDRPEWSLRQVTPNQPPRGLELLPPPSPLDVFYDIEGFPYAPTGLEYLQGVTTIEADGGLAFHDWWAHNELEEKKAFEAFIDWVWGRWQQDQTMHIYHYAGYERTAISRLSTKYATREHEVDEFLRHDVLVDLLAVVRQGLVIGTPSYSLKEIERLYLPPRDGEVVSAGASVVEYQRWLDSEESSRWQDSPILTAIRDYNRVDCDSTARLRDWLLERQREAGLTWRFPNGSEVGHEAASPGLSNSQLLAQQLLTRAEHEEGEAQRLTTLLAWLLEFHRRNDKPAWWNYFERIKKEDADLYDDPDVLIGVVRTAREPWPEKRSLVYEFGFDPDQESRFHEDSKVSIVGADVTSATIESFDAEAGLLTIKRAVGREMPEACRLLRREVVDSEVIRSAIWYYVKEWSEGRIASQAVDDLLNRRRPKLGGGGDGPVIDEQGELREETLRAVQAMDATTLAIQGPPGTGKTSTAAYVIEKLLDDGARIGVVATGHEVVNNLLAKVVSIAPRHIGRVKKVGGKGAPPGVTVIPNSGGAAAALGTGAVLIGGTAWLFCRDDLRGQLDYLFVDEAGQLSLANVVGSGLSARNIVLIGDQMQLSQPIQGAHPGESGLSCLEYLLHGEQTIPVEMGILLDESYRMHPEICRFISEGYYEGRVHASERTHSNRVDWDGLAAGVAFHSVAHDGRTQSSPEEVVRVTELTTALLGRSAVINGEPRLLTWEDILVVAPFNAQVRALKAALPEARIGTVDKFQGQQAAVVIVSMTASTIDDAPRGASFLFDPHRLNVAISRAQALALVVGSDRLGDVRVRSVEELRLVNGWCRVEEEVIAPS